MPNPFVTACCKEHLYVLPFVATIIITLDVFFSSCMIDTVIGSGFLQSLRKFALLINDKLEFCSGVVCLLFCFWRSPFKPQAESICPRFHE